MRNRLPKPEKFTAAQDGIGVLNVESAAAAAGLLAAATALAARRGLQNPPTPDTRLPWGNDGMPPAKPEESECVGETGQPFSLLHAAERYKQGNGKVIIEQNGIHIISSEAFDRDSDKEELDGDFKELVESVVGKT